LRVTFGLWLGSDATGAGVNFKPSLWGSSAACAPPPIHAELPADGHDDLLALDWWSWIAQHGLPLGHRLIGRLKLDQPPGRFHQHAPDAPVAVLVNRPLKTPLIGAVFPGTHPGITGHLPRLLNRFQSQISRSKSSEVSLPRPTGNCSGAASMIALVRALSSWSMATITRRKAPATP